jgi:hypothetical protein
MADFDELYKWMGKCITVWSAIEQDLYRLCQHAIRAPMEQVSIIFFRIPTLDGRIGLTEELITSILPKRERPNGGHDHPLVIKWKKLIADVRAELPIRNALAHSPVSSGGYLNPEITQWIGVRTSYWELQRSSVTAKQVELDKLPAHRQKIESLHEQLEKFFNELPERL